MVDAGLAGFTSSRHLLALEEGPQQARGALLQVDISGFTALTEKLGSRGKSGTEALTRILQRVFTPLLETIRLHGGEVLQFQGDGLFVGFYAPDPAQARIQAAACGRTMLETSREFQDLPTPWGTHTVRFRVAIQEGSWLEAVVGNERRTELLISGSSLVDLIRTTARAAPGSLWINGAPIGPASPEPMLPPLPAAMPEPVPVSSAFYPAGVESFLKASARGEHRVVSTVFVGVSGYAPDHPPLEAFQRLFDRVHQIVHRHGGVLARLDPSEKGHRFLLLFGAPIAREHSVLAAVRCAMALAHLRIPPFQIRVSCTTGFVYAGVVGTRWRREFTVLGDTVNLASRLLDHTPENTPVVDETSHRLTRRQMVFVQRPPLRVRGKTAPVIPWIPIRSRGSRQSPWVGREQTTRRILEWLLQHPRSTVMLKGEAGAGKSRLLQELHRTLIRESGWTVLKGRAGEGTYPLLESILRERMGVPASAPPSRQERRLLRYLASRGAPPDLRRRASFLGVMILGLEMPGSLYAQVDPELRRTNLSEAVEGLFRMEAGEKGLVLILDDLDRSTPEEVALLQEVLLRLGQDSALPRVAVLGSGRRITPDTLPLPEPFAALELPLEGLSREAVHAWLRETLQNEPPSEVVTFLAHRTRGIPLLLEEYFWFLVDRGFLVHTPAGWRFDLPSAEQTIPENVWTLVMARVDRLPPRSRRALKAGSVAGPVFPGAVVEEVVPGGGGRGLFDAAREGILQPDPTRTGWWAFRHALLQEVVYDALLEEEKRIFHRRVGEALETLLPLPYRTLAGLLAHHFREGGVWDRALHHTLEAARFAQESFHIQDARTLLQSALELLRKHNPGDHQTLCRVLEHLGQVNHIGGDLQKARECFEEMFRSCPDQPRLQARALRHLAQVEIDRSRLQEARLFLDRALSLIHGETETPDARKEKADVLILMARLAQIQRALDEARGFARKALHILEDLAGAPGLAEQDRLRSLAGALNLLCITAMYRGAYAEALQYAQQGLEAARACGDRLKESQFYGNLGLIHYDLGQWDQALAFLEKDRALSEEIGHVQGHAAVLANIGLIHLQRGACTAAREAFTRALFIQRRLGARRDEAKTLCNLGVVAFQEGNYREALSHFRAFRELSRQIGYRSGEALAALNLGDVCVRLGDVEQAETWLQEARSLLETLGDTYNLMDWHLAMGACRAARGAMKEAQDHVQKALELARSLGVPFMEARALARLAEMSEDPRQASHRFQQALEKMKTLGMRQERAETLVAWGTFLRKQGQKGWEEAFKEAARIYRDLNLVSRARDVERRLAGSPD